MDGKFYAATQTLDEARHVEVFAKYIEELDRVHPIAPGLKLLLDQTLETDNWLMKCVGMQVVVEGLALFTFRDMRDTTQEPLLERLLTYVARDEARHTAYGVKYLAAVVPSLGDGERQELEDFAFEAARMLIDSRSGMTFFQALMDIWKDVGIDPTDVLAGIQADQGKVRASVQRMGGRIGPFSGFVIPSLRRIGLLSERLEQRFRQLFDELHITVPPKSVDGAARNPLDALVSLPEDLEAWVMAGAP